MTGSETASVRAAHHPHDTVRSGLLPEKCGGAAVHNQCRQRPPRGTYRQALNEPRTTLSMTRCLIPFHPCRSQTWRVVGVWPVTHGPGCRPSTWLLVPDVSRSEPTHTSGTSQT
eukprot:scaffold2911_cov414-Prasinococcus_capsulatus_cf.AAC.22